MKAISFITPKMIAKESLLIFCNRLANDSSNCAIEYDGSYSGNKFEIGDELTTKDGRSAMGQPLSIALAFQMQDLKLSLDEFSERLIKPAILCLAAALLNNASVTNKGHKSGALIVFVDATTRMHDENFGREKLNEIPLTVEIKYDEQLEQNFIVTEVVFAVFKKFSGSQLKITRDIIGEMIPRRAGDMVTYHPWPHEWQGMSEPERVAKGIYINCYGQGEFEVLRVPEDAQFHP